MNPSHVTIARLFFACAVWCALSAVASAGDDATPAVQVPAQDQVLKSLRRDHPRLLIDAKGFAALKTRIPADAQLRAWHDAIRRDADKLLTTPPAKYEIPDGKRLLATCRTVLHRAYTLGLIYRLDGGDAYRDRLWREVQNAASFKDWNPSHFLDTAEMTHAFAIAYDWLYDDWSSEQRATIREAIVRNGLSPGLKSYRGEASYGWWRTSNHNWNQVCNGGLTMGALAIADDEPAVAAEIVSSALASVPRAMASYAPDGGWGEGVGYWHYATSYNAVMIAALQSALGTDFGLADAKGFDRTGLFPLQLHGPTGLYFNFADTGGSAHTVAAPELFWLAKRIRQPVYAAYERRVARPEPLDLIWYPPADAPNGAKAAPALPRDAYFRRSEVVTLRTAWDEPAAWFIAFKAGDNKVNHSHLDLGTFVLDALGERWAIDLGSDDYNLPGYFGGKRWTYYRLRAEGHNTLVLNPGQDADQDPRAAAKVARFKPGGDTSSGGGGGASFAIADLTPAYAKDAQSVQRGVKLFARGAVLVQDELHCKEPGELWWFMHTRAQVTVKEGGRAAVLEQNGKRLLARIAEPADARFEVRPAEPLPTSPAPAGQAKNPGVRKLAVHLSGVRDVRLAVVFDAVNDADAPALPATGPLAQW
jgi:Heparinase II/III-like protein